MATTRVPGEKVGAFMDALLEGTLVYPIDHGEARARLAAERILGVGAFSVDRMFRAPSPPWRARVATVGVVAGLALSGGLAACSGSEANGSSGSTIGSSPTIPSTGLAAADGAPGSTVALSDLVVGDTAPPPVHPETPAHQRLVALGIPDIAARAYLNASARAAEALPNCTIPPEVLAAVGGQESRDGQVGEFDADGNSREIIKGYAEVGPDTEGGALDGDPDQDWAVGPMQFTPGTWKDLARDGNDDGRMDPSNFFDAALAAAAYLCHFGGPFPSASFIAVQWNQWDQKVTAQKQRTDTLHAQWQKQKDHKQEIQDFVDAHPEDTADAQVLARTPDPGPEPTYTEPDQLPGPAQFTRAVEGYYGPSGDVRDDYVERVSSAFRRLASATGGVTVTVDDRWA